MVSFNNIVVNQRVEVRRRGRIYKGTVKYKGPINGQLGDWVGVALDMPAGDCDGMVNARRYFACMQGHGVFTQAHEIRFVRLKRRLYSTYRSVQDTDILKEDLFGTQAPEVKNGPYDPISTSNSYSNLSDSLDDDLYKPAPNHTLRHSVGSSLQAATMRRPQTARPNYTYRFNPIHVEYENDFDDFISSPSIPLPHMPYHALRQQCRKGWEEPHTHLVREWSVHTGRESVLYNTWNGV